MKIYVHLASNGHEIFIHSMNMLPQIFHTNRITNTIAIDYQYKICYPRINLFYIEQCTNNNKHNIKVIFDPRTNLFLQQKSYPRINFMITTHNIEVKMLKQALNGPVRVLA